MVTHDLKELSETRISARGMEWQFFRACQRKANSCCWTVVTASNGTEYRKLLNWSGAKGGDSHAPLRWLRKARANHGNAVK